MHYKLKLQEGRLSRWSRSKTALLWLSLTLLAITGCSTAGSVIPVKPYFLPEYPTSAMAQCGDPESLPAWMETIELPAGLAEWERENLGNINRNGRAWAICRGRQAELVRWIRELPEP